MDQNEHGNSTPVPGLHGFGGEAVHQAKDTGHWKLGIVDDKEMKEIEEASDEDLSIWVLETHDSIHYRIEELVTLTDKMFSFSTATKNLHKDMKIWCAELKTRVKKALEASERFKPYAAKASNRIQNLSSSLLESSIRRVKTEDKMTNTEPTAPALVKGDDGSNLRANNMDGNRTHSRKQTTEREKLREDKKKRSKMKYAKATIDRAGQKDQIPGNYNKRNNEAVVVCPTGSTSYAEVARKLKKSIDVSELDINIRSMRRTKMGHLILQIDKGPEMEESAARLKEAVTLALGQEATVKHKTSMETVEICDLEPETTAEEIVQAVVKRTGSAPDLTKVLRILPSFGGSMMAVIKLKSRDAHEILRQGRITVGLVRCRVRLKAQKIRCFRCHGYGHIRATCRGPDRTALCMTCGDDGHKAKDCKAPPKCVLCEEAGYGVSHYPGSQACRSKDTAVQRR